MSERRIGALLSLVRQGLSLGVEFGARSLEALLWVAETVEESVYEHGSLTRTQDGLAFALANPPLRNGAFRAVRAFVDGRPADPQHLRVRSGEGKPWAIATAITESTPLELRPGQRTEVAVGGLTAPMVGPVWVRLELESVAIPPLVWFEFRDAPRPVEER